MLGGHGGGGMTVPHGDLETTLRRELTAAVDGVEPAPDALERIRARTALRPPQPWLLTVASGAVSRARHWVWHGHWAWPESLPRPRAVSWPGAGWATRVKRATGGDWLRPVAVLAGVAFIAIVALSAAGWHCDAAFHPGAAVLPGPIGLVPAVLCAPLPNVPAPPPPCVPLPLVPPPPDVWPPVSTLEVT